MGRIVGRPGRAEVGESFVIAGSQTRTACRQPRPDLSDEFQYQTYRATLERLDASLLRTRETADNGLNSVRDVIVVASCSRSGSSLLVELMKRSTTFTHFCAEMNPFLRLAGLGWPQSDVDSDSLSGSHYTGLARDIVQRHLSAEIGSPGELDHYVGEDELYLERLYRRLCMQWPLERFSVEEIRGCAIRAQRQAGLVGAGARLLDFEFQVFFVLLLLELRRAHAPLNPYYYDLDRALIRELAPEIQLPSGSPSVVLVEEPPFVLTRPWRMERAPTFQRPLIVKTPSNAYRPSFLRAMFPSARIRTLHLTRNPGAAINGLCDGWRHWAFHSHFVGMEPGARCHVQRPAPDRGWWKFDLPPGWRHHLGEPLEHICGFQWSSAQRAILEAEDFGGSLRVKFEDILFGFHDNPEGLFELRSWLGDGDFLGVPSEPCSPVMSTHPPRPGRWRDNESRLRPVINSRSVRSLIDVLGYSDESKWL